MSLGSCHFMNETYRDLASFYSRIQRYAEHYDKQALETSRNQTGGNIVADIVTSSVALPFTCRRRYDKQALETSRKQTGGDLVADIVASSVALPFTWQVNGSATDDVRKEQQQKLTTSRQLGDDEPDNVGNEWQAETVAKLKPTNWKQVSVKHRQRFEKLLELWGTNSGSIKIIGGNGVCFEDEFSIGTGCYGTKVYICLGTDGIERAIKCLPKYLGQNCLRQERDILTSRNLIESPRIVNYCFFDERFDSHFDYLILSLYEQNLKEYTEDESTVITESQARKMIRQMLEGLIALHSREPRILHRDLKPANILINVKGDLVLSDFGIGRFFPKEGIYIIRYLTVILRTRVVYEVIADQRGSWHGVGYQ